MIVAVADIIMSVDNVIAIAAAARGDFLLLVIGIAVSVPMIMAGAAMIIALIDRFPILVWAGAALLGWVAGDTIATDPAVIHFAAAFGDDFPQRAELAAACCGNSSCCRHRRTVAALACHQGASADARMQKRDAVSLSIARICASLYTPS